MSQHDHRMNLEHMLNHSREILELTRNCTRLDLDENRLLNLSLVRLLEIVGEAAGRISQETRDANPQIAWKQIVGMRNKLIHGYDEVDFDILWAIITVDIPVLVKELEDILE